MASNLTLYWISGSPPCWRAMLCLEEKQLHGYKSKLFSYEKQDHKTPEYKKISPRLEVPTLCDGDIVINESLAICLYLEDKFKSQGTCLLPPDWAARALALQRMHETQNVIRNVFEKYMAIMWFNQPEQQDKELMKKKAEAAAAELARWDTYLEQSGPGSYIGGKAFTIADVAFIPALGLMASMGLKWDNYPHLKAYHDLVSQRPAVQAVRPTHWEGEQGKDFLKDL